MQVTRLQAFRVRLPLVHEFETSSHRKSYLEHILVRVESPDGAVGWGEIASPSDPYFVSETVDTCWHVVQRYLGPALVGSTFDRPQDAVSRWAKVRGHNFAKAGVEAACWDLHGRAQGTSLAALLGGERREVVAGVSLGIESTVDALIEQVAKHVAQGYPRVKLKIAPGWDVEPVRAVRAAYPDLAMHVDANGAYAEIPEHLAVFAALDDAGLVMIEQPFAPRALAAHARLAGLISTPICLDESIEDIHDLDTASSIGALQILNIKVSRMGGFTAARAAHDLAVERGIPVWCGGMHEFGIGRAGNVAIASLPGFSLPSDVSGSDKYYRRDVIVPPVVANAGTVTVPWDSQGIGHDVDEDFVRASSTDLLEIG